MFGTIVGTRRNFGTVVRKAVLHATQAKMKKSTAASREKHLFECNQFSGVNRTTSRCWTATKRSSANSEKKNPYYVALRHIKTSLIRIGNQFLPIATKLLFGDIREPKEEEKDFFQFFHDLQIAVRLSGVANCCHLESIQFQ